MISANVVRQLERSHEDDVNKVSILTFFIDLLTSCKSQRFIHLEDVLDELFAGKTLKHGHGSQKFNPFLNLGIFNNSQTLIVALFGKPSQLTVRVCLDLGRSQAIFYL